MSEKLCTLRTQGGGGGGKQTETVLWTNSAPTSSFAKQDVTLSDDINSYDYLKFTYRVTTSVSDSLNYIISVSDFKKSVESTSSHHCVLGLSTDDSVAHTRRVYYKTDTTVNFNNAYQLNAAASNNATVIPLSIVGIKHMYGKMEHYASGYFTTGRTSVDLGFVPKYVFCANGAPSTTSPNSTVEVYDANVSTTQYHMIGADVDEMRTIGAIGTANQFCMEGTVIGMNPNQNFSLLKNGRRYYWAIG